MECVPCFNAERGGRYGDTLWSNQSVIKFSFAVCHQIFILKNKGWKNNMSKEKAKHIWFLGVMDIPIIRIFAAIYYALTVPVAVYSLSPLIQIVW